MSTTQVTITQLATAVTHSDSFNGKTSRAQIAHILEQALKMHIGIACLGMPAIHVDLENGHLLRCAVVAQEGAHEKL